jgi:tetratricopeptide (TPR) repeat protein
MKKLITLIIIILSASRSFAMTTDTATIQQETPYISNNIDSLKFHLQLIANDSLKSGIYSQIAAQYLKYDTIPNRSVKKMYQNNALNYTYLALHVYSKYNDTVGLRNCFNNLAKVYRSQKKYSQAKWFILQSNTLSRVKKDVPNITASLIELAAIKMDIKDYSLAMTDLNEALKLSTTSRDPRAESRVQEKYALLYSHLKNYTKEAIAMKRHDFIEDSIKKGEEALLIAKLNAKDSVQTKKKLNTVPAKKTYKPNYSKRIASL